MLDISVTYMGLRLNSPFIAASSGYTTDVNKIIALSRCGIGAIVLRSLFEEQINSEIERMEMLSAEYPENADLLQRYVTGDSVSKYKELIREIKGKVKIPLIASICCYTRGNWISFAKELEEAGADALELNIYSLPLSVEKSSNEIEQEYALMVGNVVSSVKIPVAVKIADQYTNPLRFLKMVESYGASAAVLFNRFYRPDISLKSMKIVSGNLFSCKSEYFKELRWIAISSAQLKSMELSASTGVHDSQAAIKLLLAGAKSVQLCSVLYQQGPFVVATFVEELRSFMKEKGFERVSDFCGMLNYANIGDPALFERVQFLKAAKHYSHNK